MECVDMPNKITCPNCGHEIDIENLIQAGAKDALDKQLAIQKAAFEKAKEEEIQSILKEQKQKQQEKEEELRKKILSEQEEAKSELEKELKEKSEQVKELNKLKIEKARLEREKEELKDSIQAESEKEFNQRLVLGQCFVRAIKSQKTFLLQSLCFFLVGLILCC